MAAKTGWCGLLLYNSANSTWQVPQTFATELTCGGVAPWFPWHEAQVGAERSPPASAAQCTLVRYPANWFVSILYLAMCSALAWHRAQVSGSRSGYTGDWASFTARMSCTLWQSMQVATASSPAARRLPCMLV